MKTVIIAVFIILSIPFAAAAESDVILPVLSEESLRGLYQPPSEPLRQVIDQLRLQREDNSIIALSGIDIPTENSGEPGAQALAARDFLEKLFENPSQRALILYQTATRTGQPDQGRKNRLGQGLAQLIRKDGHIWVQGALIANGLAQARPTPSNPELAAEMYALEKTAQAEKRGLWADDSPYRLYSANETFESLNRFAVVEGVVEKVATVNNVTYLNFGPDWKTDFTVGIPAATRQIMARNGIDVFQLQGQKLRVRGWVRSYNGPYMELEHPVLLQQEKDVQN